jgi:hypothetical protein
MASISCSSHRTREYQELQASNLKDLSRMLRWSVTQNHNEDILLFETYKLIRKGNKYQEIACKNEDETYFSSKRIYYYSSVVAAKIKAAGETSESGMTGVLSNSAFSISYYVNYLSFLSCVI